MAIALRHSAAGALLSLHQISDRVAKTWADYWAREPQRQPLDLRRLGDRELRDLGIGRGLEPGSAGEAWSRPWADYPRPCN